MRRNGMLLQVEQLNQDPRYLTDAELAFNMDRLLHTVGVLTREPHEQIQGYISLLRERIEQLEDERNGLADKLDYS